METTTTHTPGPWRIGDAGMTIFGPKSENPSPVMVANLPRPTIRASNDVRRANARLIAAAPDLLAALRGLLTPCRCDPAPGTACAHVLAAEAAIARATGEV